MTVGMLPWPGTSPTRNNPGVESKQPSPPAPSLTLLLDLGPATLASLDRTILPQQVPSPDLSPIRWLVRVTRPGVPCSQPQNIYGLCYNGAHGEFLAQDIATRMGLELQPVDRPTSVCLPDGSHLPITHQCSLTVEIDRQYKADLLFKISP